MEVLSQCLDLWILLLQLIDAYGIRDRFNKATSWTSGDDVEWLEPQFELVGLKDRLELTDEL